MTEKQAKNIRKSKSSNEKDVLCKQCKKELKKDGSDFCSTECELQFLRSQVERLNSKKKDPVCLQKVEFGETTIEFYRRNTFEAKRRGNSLRKLGLECVVSGAGIAWIDGKPTRVAVVAINTASLTPERAAAL